MVPDLAPVKLRLSNSERNPTVSAEIEGGFKFEQRASLKLKERERARERARGIARLFLARGGSAGPWRICRAMSAKEVVAAEVALAVPGSGILSGVGILSGRCLLWVLENWANLVE